ncbi:hypothetical protein [Thiorhodococcus fuscus]|uniref:Uncharacterized protein n=1 Tax=Thiorhodococcus fuscus TaxID=527200 RepID=A0ABW4Y6Y3_9GAMM
MYNEQLQTVTITQDVQRDRERAQRLRGALTQMSLRDENRLYAQTRGISQNNRDYGFRPGYLNRSTGEYQLSRFSDGTLAPIHVLDGLPESWIADRDAEGHVTAARREIVSGFVRDNAFFTREEAIKASAH